MEYEVHAFHGPLARRRIGDAPAQELDPVAERQEVPQVAGGQIVQHGHGVAKGDEGLHEVGADEAGAACDEIAHPSCSPPRNERSEPNATTHLVVQVSSQPVRAARLRRRCRAWATRVGVSRRVDAAARHWHRSRMVPVHCKWNYVCSRPEGVHQVRVERACSYTSARHARSDESATLADCKGIPRTCQVAIRSRRSRPRWRTSGR